MAIDTSGIRQFVILLTAEVSAASEGVGKAFAPFHAGRSVRNSRGLISRDGPVRPRGPQPTTRGFCPTIEIALVAVTPWLAEPSGQRKSRIRTPVAPIWRPGPPRTTEKMPPGSRRFDCRVVLKVITQQATALLGDRADQVKPQKLVAIKEKPPRTCGGCGDPPRGVSGRVVSTGAWGIRG